MFIQDLDVEADSLLAGKCIHIAADGMHLTGDARSGFQKRLIADLYWSSILLTVRELPLTAPVTVTLTSFSFFRSAMNFLA